MEHIKDEFLTVSSGNEVLFKDKGSKFYGYAFHANSEEEVKHHLNELRAQHHQARHVCYGYILDLDGKQTRANDDGEPGHSAGTPILNQIKSAELVETLVAVVRYFGGTKLGVSGLINAYKTAAEMAIEESIQKKIHKTSEVAVTVPFDLINQIMRFTKLEEVELVNQVYEENVTLTLRIKQGSFLTVLTDLQKIHQAQLAFDEDSI